jgi:hypothetical protein
MESKLRMGVHLLGGQCEVSSGLRVKSKFFILEFHRVGSVILMKLEEVTQ